MKSKFRLMTPAFAFLVLLLTLSGPGSARGGCESDGDCKGNRVCHEQQCVDPVGLPCSKDTDCPGDLLCHETACIEEGAPALRVAPPPAAPTERTVQENLDIAFERAGDARRRLEGARFLSVTGLVVQTTGVAYSAGLFYVGAPLACGGAIIWGLSGLAVHESILRANDGLWHLGRAPYEDSALRDGRILFVVSLGATTGAGLLSACSSWIFTSDLSNDQRQTARVSVAILAGLASFAPSLIAALLLEKAAKEVLARLSEATNAGRFAEHPPHRQRPHLIVLPTVVATEDSAGLGMTGNW